MWRLSESFPVATRRTAAKTPDGPKRIFPVGRNTKRNSCQTAAVHNKKKSWTSYKNKFWRPVQLPACHQAVVLYVLPCLSSFLLADAPWRITGVTEAGCEVCTLHGLQYSEAWKLSAECTWWATRFKWTGRHIGSRGLSGHTLGSWVAEESPTRK